ncbi:MAG TPA: hypothetical protein VGD64_12130 [Acidisarcina sp.]
MSKMIENDIRGAGEMGIGGVKSCEKSEEYLAELLLTPEGASSNLGGGTSDASLSAARAHVESCPICVKELAELHSTMALLDEWSAPDPTPYFATKLLARLRSEQAAAPAGWFERVKARMLFGSNMQLRPIAAGVLAIMLVAGGGTFSVLSMHQKAIPAESATVHDLQNLDGNAQVFQQLDSLDQHDQNDNDADDPSTL